MAKSDVGVTALPGKPEFDDLLARAMGNGGSAGTVSLALFDIDSFLEVNTKHGHGEGDRVLNALIAVFQEMFGAAGGSLFRIGGDEFAVVLASTEKEQSFLQLERARSAFANLAALGSIDPRPSISIGVATYPDDGATRQEVVRKADDALYRAKLAGRNRVTLAREEKKVPKTIHFTQGQLDRLSALSTREAVGEAELLREALDDLLKKYTS